MHVAGEASADLEDRLLDALREIVAMLLIERADRPPGESSLETGPKAVQALGRKRLLH